MGLEFTIEVSIKPKDVMERLSRVVTKASPFWAAAVGAAGLPMRLMGQLEGLSFRVFVAKPYPRGMPRVATGRVQETAEGSLIRVRIGFGTWNACCIAFALGVLTVACGACLLLFRPFGGNGHGLFRGLAGFVLAVWLATAGGVLGDWFRNRKEGPLLKRALEELFADVAVSAHDV